MKTLTRTTTYPFQPEEVFNCLDNLGVTGMHMTQSSMMMMGSMLDLKFLTEHHTGLGTKYQWTGRMMGFKMDFTVEVTRWVPGEEKVWETIGNAQMIIYSWYRMHLLLTVDSKGTLAQLSITYRRHSGVVYQFLSFLFANWYCRWCLKNMLDDCKKTLLKKIKHNGA